MRGFKLVKIKFRFWSQIWKISRWELKLNLNFKSFRIKIRFSNQVWNSSRLNFVFKTKFEMFQGSSLEISELNFFFQTQILMINLKLFKVKIYFHRKKFPELKFAHKIKFQDYNWSTTSNIKFFKVKFWIKIEFETFHDWN